MSKAEEILESHLPEPPNGATGYLTRKQRRRLSLAAINEALEWAAKQCEEEAKRERKYRVAEDCAERIRAGKSQ